MSTDVRLWSMRLFYFLLKFNNSHEVRNQEYLSLVKSWKWEMTSNLWRDDHRVIRRNGHTQMLLSLHSECRCEKWSDTLISIKTQMVYMAMIHSTECQHSVTKNEMDSSGNLQACFTYELRYFGTGLSISRVDNPSLLGKDSKYLRFCRPRDKIEVVTWVLI